MPRASDGPARSSTIQTGNFEVFDDCLLCHEQIYISLQPFGVFEYWTSMVRITARTVDGIDAVGVANFFIPEASLEMSQSNANLFGSRNHSWYSYMLLSRHFCVTDPGKLL